MHMFNHLKCCGTFLAYLWPLVRPFFEAIKEFSTVEVDIFNHRGIDLHSPRFLLSLLLAHFPLTATRVACSVPSSDSRGILLTNGLTNQPRPVGIRRDRETERPSTNTPSSASSSLQ